MRPKALRYVWPKKAREPITRDRSAVLENEVERGREYHRMRWSYRGKRRVNLARSKSSQFDHRSSGCTPIYGDPSECRQNTSPGKSSLFCSGAYQELICDEEVPF